MAAFKWKSKKLPITFRSGSLKTRFTQSKISNGLGLFGLRPLPKLRLSHQLLGFFVLVVLFPLLVLSFSIYGINQKALKKQVAQFTASTAEAIYNELDMELRWQKEEALLTSAYWQMISDIKLPGIRQEKIDAFFTTHPDYVALAHYDKNGIMQSVFQPNNTSADIPVPVTIPTSKQSVDFKLLYDPLFHKTPDKTYSLEILVPSEKGTWLFLKHFSYLGNLIHQRYDAFHTGLLIIDDSGRILASPSPQIGQMLSKEDLVRYQSLKEGMMKQFASVKPSYPLANQDDDDIPRLEKVLIRLPDIEWGLIIESPYSIERSYIAKAQTQSVALVFLCIGVIIVLGLLYSRGINRNFRQLIKGVKALAEGKYTRKIRLITKSWTPYEVVYLTAEVNRMAMKISSAWSSIQMLNQELEKANDQLSKVDELKSNLIDTVSHELRTPLTNIIGYTSRLIRYEAHLDSETKIKSLKVIKQQALRLNRLVEDLLVIPDLEREGGIRVFPDRVNLNDMLTRNVAFMEEKAGRPIRIDGLTEDIDVLVDPDRLEQVLVNLLDNAIKYSPEEATIEINVSPSNKGFIQIQVFNPCDPVSEEDLATLFSKFKRLDERLTRTTRGTGLGLFITKNLVQAMGGMIRLDGKDGFRVIMDIPLWDEQAPTSGAGVEYYEEQLQ